MPAFHAWAVLAMVLYGVVVMARQPWLGAEFLASVALVEFVLARGN